MVFYRGNRQELINRSYEEFRKKWLPYLEKFTAATLNWDDQPFENVAEINMTDPTELTIASGVITKTQGFHTVDTESDAASDYLDTINGGSVGDILTLSGANDAREVIITRTGNIRFPPDHLVEGFSFRSPTGGSGTYYASGYYYAPAADANLTQASATQTFGSANSGYGAHAFLVAAAPGTKNAGSVSIVVSGTSIANDGTRTAADSETIVADITAMSANAYYETDKRWIGQITYTLTAVGAATYAADFNYGLAAYDTLDERNHTVKLFEVMGRAGANDSGFDIQLLHHKTTGWTYSAAAFVPGTTLLCSWATDYNTEKNLVSGERFKYERELSQAIDGTSGEGTLVKIITSANNAVEFMDISIYCEAIPNDHHLKNTNQAVQLMHNGTNWMKL